MLSNPSELSTSVNNYTLPGSPLGGPDYLSSCCADTTITNGCGTGCDQATFTNDNAWGDASGLTETITVTTRRAVLAHYAITWYGASQPYMASAMWIDDKKLDSSVTILGTPTAGTDLCTPLPAPVDPRACDF